MMLNGLNVQVSPLAVTQSPRRPHKKRRNQTEAYHNRIAKKWRKRFGTVERPAAFKVADVFGGRDRLIVHPAIMEKLRRDVPVCVDPFVSWPRAWVRNATSNALRIATIT